MALVSEPLDRVRKKKIGHLIVIWLFLLNVLGVFRICDDYYQVDASYDSAGVGEIMTSLII